MNFWKLYRRADNFLQERYPILWVLGVHFYVPLITILGLVLFGIGFAFRMEPLQYWDDYSDFVQNVEVSMFMPAILLAILFIIRQIKFNSKRVHLKLPYHRLFAVLLYFFVLFFTITALPFCVNFGALVRSSWHLDEKQFEKDLEILEKGYCHFYLQMDYVDTTNGTVYSGNEGQMEAVPAPPQKIEHVEKYRLTGHKDSLIVYRDFMIYNHRNKEWDTISLEDAYKEIEAFILVANKYEGHTTKSNPFDIFQGNIAAKKTLYVNHVGDAEAYNHFKTYTRFDNNITFNNNFLQRDSIYFVSKISFWQYYLFVALSLAVLLLIVCSTQIVDFGWAMLVCALHPTVFGILYFILDYLFKQSTISNSVIVLLLLWVFTLNGIYTAFFSRFRATIKRAFAISLHIYVPILIVLNLTIFQKIMGCCWRDYDPLYKDCRCFYPFNRDEFYLMIWGMALLSIFVFTYLFGRYYKKQYINPQPD